MIRRMTLAVLALIVAAAATTSIGSTGAGADSFEWGAKVPTNISAMVDH